MSVKTETIEVRRCDFCVNKTEARACDHCSKDACQNCGKVWTLWSKRWEIPAYVNTLGGREEVFSAFFCNDCAKNELTTAMLRFGFPEP